ncbi:MAG: hypothetical protein ACP5TZ_06415, partial [Nitrososphaeria archaeon]
NEMIVGIDAHKRNCVVSTFDDSYNLMETFEFSTTRNRVNELMEKVPEGPTIIIEARTPGKRCLGYYLQNMWFT